MRTTPTPNRARAPRSPYAGVPGAAPSQPRTARASASRAGARDASVATPRRVSLVERQATYASGAKPVGPASAAASPATRARARSPRANPRPAPSPRRQRAPDARKPPRRRARTHRRRPPRTASVARSDSYWAETPTPTPTTPVPRPRLPSPSSPRSNAHPRVVRTPRPVPRPRPGPGPGPVVARVPRRPRFARRPPNRDARHPPALEKSAPPRGRPGFTTRTPFRSVCSRPRTRAASSRRKPRAPPNARGSWRRFSPNRTRSSRASPR